MTTFHCGSVCIAGRPNVGKSTLLNRLVGTKIAAVSSRAQTTRQLVRGIATTSDCQIVFVDSPGLQGTYTNQLSRVMNRRASGAIADSDLILAVVTAGRLDADTKSVIEHIPSGQRVIAAINKVDLLSDKQTLLPLIRSIAEIRNFLAIVPVSAKSGYGIPELRMELCNRLPEQEALYPADDLTDQDERFFAVEFMREKLFHNLGEDIPYRCEVVLDDFKDDNGIRRIAMTIYVERDSQKSIVIGSGGEKLKRIAELAREDMERLFGGKVFLSVWVKVRKGWTDDARILAQFGHG